MQHMFSSEILEQFRAGRKEFSNIHTQFCELEGLDLSGLVIRDSKLEFTSFRNSNMKNAKLINCEMFFFSLYNADVENVVIDRCSIDTARLENMSAKNTKIINSRLSWVGMFNVNLGEIDMRGTTEFKVFKHISELTENDAQEAVARLGSHFEFLPLEMKTYFGQIVKQAISEAGKDPSLGDVSLRAGNEAYGPAQKSDSYLKTSAIYDAFSAISDEIMKYGASQAYKQHDAYEKKDKKKDNF